MHGDSCARADCATGRRHFSVHLLSGAVLPLMRRLEQMRARSSWGRCAWQPGRGLGRGAALRGSSCPALEQQRNAGGGLDGFTGRHLAAASLLSLPRPACHCPAACCLPPRRVYSSDSAANTTKPLRIVKAITNSGDSVVGIEAACKEEMAHW